MCIKQIKILSTSKLLEFEGIYETIYYEYVVFGIFYRECCI
jgi:hypothetical protein